MCFIYTVPEIVMLSPNTEREQRVLQVEVATCMPRSLHKNSTNKDFLNSSGRQSPAGM